MSHQGSFMHRHFYTKCVFQVIQVQPQQEVHDDLDARTDSCEGLGVPFLGQHTFQPEINHVHSRTR